MKEFENLIEGIQRLCREVRENLIPAYEEIGASGIFGKAMLEADVKEGEAAIASGDVVRMLAAYKILEGCE